MPTISELIELITASEARKPYKKTLRFDPTYGYPVEVFFDFDQNIADEELGFVITSFTKR